MDRQKGENAAGNNDTTDRLRGGHEMVHNLRTVHIPGSDVFPPMAQILHIPEIFRGPAGGADSDDGGIFLRDILQPVAMV